MCTLALYLKTFLKLKRLYLLFYDPSSPMFPMNLTSDATDLRIEARSLES